MPFEWWYHRSESIQLAYAFEVFGALQLLKSAYRNGHIQAAAEAGARVQPPATVTDDNFDLTLLHLIDT